jgi:hypothetical protein
MAKAIDWLSEKKYQVHLTAFLLMVISAVGMFWAAQNDIDVLILALIGVVVIANLLVMLTR